MGVRKGCFSGMNNPFYGKKHTEETKLKMAIAKKGKSPINKDKVFLNPKEFYLINKAIEYNISGREFENILGISRRYYYKVKNKEILEYDLFYKSSSEENNYSKDIEKLELFILDKSNKKKNQKKSKSNKQKNVNKLKKMQNKMIGDECPSIIDMWDYDRNEKTPYQVESNSQEEIFIECNIHGKLHKPRKARNIRNSIIYKGTNGCVRCSQLKVGAKNRKSQQQYIEELNQIGFGIKISPNSEYINSDTEIEHICHCGNTFMAKPQNIIGRLKKSCGCLTASYPEIYTASLLKALNVDYYYQKTYNDLKSDLNGVYRFDFVIDSHNVIIEPNGRQHDTLANFGKSKSKEEMIEDLLKVKKSDKEKDDYCKNVLKYNMVRIPQKLYDGHIDTCEAKKIIMECLGFKYNENLKFEILWKFNNRQDDIIRMHSQKMSTLQIAKSLNCDYYTVHGVLKKLGLKSNRNYASGDRNKNSKPIVQLNLDGTFIERYTSISQAEKKLGFGHGNIGACCLGKTQTAYGYIWMNEIDYKNLNDKKDIKYNYKTEKVAKLCKDTGKVIREYTSMTDAAKDVGGDVRNISACCNGNRKTAYNYKWIKINI